MVLSVVVTLWALYALSTALSTPRNESPAPEQAGKNKRGIAYEYGQHGVIRLFNDPNSKVTWIYNWNSDTGPTNMGYEFNPMLWSDRQNDLDRWAGNVDKCTRAGPGLTRVLSFNEPDCIGGGHHGASCVDLDRAVDTHRQHIDVLKNRYGEKVRIGSPGVTNSASPDGLEWLRRFMEKCGDCQIDFVAIHWYDRPDNIEYFKKHIRDAHHVTRRPVWITEIGFSNNPNEEQVKNFLKAVMPWLDGEYYVHRYVFGMAMKGSLLNAAGNGLSEIGRLYNTG